MLHIGGNSNSLSVSGGSDGWSWRYDGGNEIYSTVNLSSEYLLTFVRPAGGDFSSASFFIYGIEQTRTSGGNDNGLPSSNELIFTVGSNSDGTRTFYNGAIGEIIVTESDSNDMRQKTEGYLAQKWGLGANLPNSHPFKMILHYLVWIPMAHLPPIKLSTTRPMIVITPSLFLQQTIITLLLTKISL